MSAPDDIPSISGAEKREKSPSSSESMSQPSTTPPIEPRPSTSNGHESGHTLGEHRLHSSGQLGNHHSRPHSAGRSSTDSRSSASGGRSSHGDRVRRLSSMRDRVLISNANNAMARGMSLNELDDTTTTASSSPSPHMNGHDHSSNNTTTTDDDQQRAGISNGSRKKKKKKKHWHRSSDDSDLMGWTGLYPNLAAATNQVLDTNPGLETQTSDELRALSRRGLMVYPREAQGSEEAAAAAAATATAAAEPTQPPPTPQSLATSPSPMSSPMIESSLSPNSELNRNLTPGPETTGLVPELEPTITTSTNLTTTTTASNSSNCDAPAAATPRAKSVPADAKKQLQSEEKQKQQVLGPSKRQGSPLEKPNDEKKTKHSDEVKDQLSINQKKEPSRSRSKSLNIQDLPPNLEQANSRSKSQDSLVLVVQQLSSNQKVDKKEASLPQKPDLIKAKSHSPSVSIVTNSKMPSPNAMASEKPSIYVVVPKLLSPDPESLSRSGVKPKIPYKIVAEPPGLSTSSAKPEEPATSSSNPEEPATSSSAKPEEPSTSLATKPASPASSGELKSMLPPNNTASSAATKRKATDKYYRKPFAYGWRRELVLPSTNKPKRRAGDVFFISPNGRKLRSRDDIKPLLQGDLTIDNFCFQRVSQEVGPEYEIVRYATPSLNRSKHNDGELDSQELAVTGKRVPKPKVPKGASPPSEGWTSTSALKGKVYNRGLSSNGGASVSHKSSKLPEMSSKEDNSLWLEKMGTSEQKSSLPLTQTQQQEIAPPENPMPMDVFEISDESEENDNASNSSSSLMEIAEEVELPGQLPSASLFEEQEMEQGQGQVLEQGQNHPYRPLKDMDVVVIGGRKAIFVRGPPERPAVKLVPRLPDLSSYDRIYRKRIQEKRMSQTVAMSLNDAHLGVNVLAAVMKTMNMKERVTMSQVCSTWAMVSRDNRVWNRVVLRDTVVKSWTKLLTEMARHRTRELDMMGVVVDPNDRLSSDLRLLKSLRVLRTDATTNDFLKLVQSCLPRLKELRMTCVSAHLNLGRLERMRNLRVLRINMTHPKAQLVNVGSMYNLDLITELSIRGVTNLKSLNLREIRLLHRLEILKLGSCDTINHESLGRSVVASLKNLLTLRIENDHKVMTVYPVDAILSGVAQAGDVERLELINVDVDSNFGQQLAKCSNVTSLLLAPKCLHNTAAMTNAVMQAIRDNSNQLVIFRLVLVNELLSATENLYKGSQKNVIPVQRPVPGIPPEDALNHCSPEDNCQEEDHSQCVAFLPVERLKQILKEMMPMGFVSIAKVAMSETTNVQFLETGEAVRA